VLKLIALVFVGLFVLGIIVDVATNDSTTTTLPPQTKPETTTPPAQPKPEATPAKPENTPEATTPPQTKSEATTPTTPEPTTPTKPEATTPTKPETTTPTKPETTTKPQVLSGDALKDAVLKTIDALGNAEVYGNEALKNYLGLVQRYLKEHAWTSRDFRDISLDFAKVFSMQKYVLSDVAIPENMPQNVKDALQQSKDDLITAWALRQVGAETVAKFTQTGNIADLNTAMDKFELAGGAVDEAAYHAVQAKAFAGITP